MNASPEMNPLRRCCSSARRRRDGAGRGSANAQFTEPPRRRPRPEGGEGCARIMVRTERNEYRAQTRARSMSATTKCCSSCSSTRSSPPTRSRVSSSDLGESRRRRGSRNSAGTALSDSRGPIHVAEDRSDQRRSKSERSRLVRLSLVPGPNTSIRPRGPRDVPGFASRAGTFATTPPRTWSAFGSCTSTCAYTSTRFLQADGVQTSGAPTQLFVAYGLINRY